MLPAPPIPDAAAAHDSPVACVTPSLHHLVTPSAPAPAALSSQDAAVLLALLDTPGSVAHAATSRGITAEKFLELIASPAARQAIEDVRAFAAARREIRADADREEFTAVLREVARASPDLIEKRRAATAGLRALDRARDRGGDMGGMAAARRSHVGPRAARDPYSRPWREIRIPRPARSEWETAEPNGQLSTPGATACPAATTATRSSTPTAGKPCDESSVPDPAAPSESPPSRAHGPTGSRAHSSTPLPSSLPSPSFTPQITADIQLAALRTNDTPEPDSGIATVHAFFPPGIGDYSLFAERYRDGLKSLVGPQDTYTLALLREEGDRAVVRAALIPDRGIHVGAMATALGGYGSPPPPSVILFHLARTPTPAGPCWLNTALQFCDSG